MTINPTLFKGKFIRDVREHLDDSKDPELQFKLRGKNNNVEEIIKTWDVGIFSDFDQPPVVKDIGRGWMKKMNFKKAKKSSIPVAMKWETPE